MKRKGQFKWRGGKRATSNKFSNSYTQGIEILRKKKKQKKEENDSQHLSSTTLTHLARDKLS